MKAKKKRRSNRVASDDWLDCCCSVLHAPMNAPIEFERRRQEAERERCRKALPKLLKQMKRKMQSN